MVSTGRDEGVTASAAGLSRQKQVPIMLYKIESNGGVAQMPDIYQAIEKEIGQKLSEQGRASLREVVNTQSCSARVLLFCFTDLHGLKYFSKNRLL